VKKNKQLTDLQILKIAESCDEISMSKKANHFTLLDIRKVNSFFNYFIIISGDSQVQCVSIAKELNNFLSKSGMREINKANLDTSWIVLDYSEIIIHIFTEEVKGFYQLEKLWSDGIKIR
jgi:ribosome-associated protein